MGSNEDELLDHVGTMTEAIVKLASSQQSKNHDEVIAKMRKSVSQEIDTKLENVKSSIDELKEIIVGFARSAGKNKKPAPSKRSTFKTTTLLK